MVQMTFVWYLSCYIMGKYRSPAACLQLHQTVTCTKIAMTSTDTAIRHEVKMAAMLS